MLEQLIIFQTWASVIVAVLGMSALFCCGLMFAYGVIGETLGFWR